MNEEKKKSHQECWKPIKRTCAAYNKRGDNEE